tara:strand:+ start:788 stop:1114 length:327 start_codon:yes stop_codon:yes gene_type:complete
MKDNELIAEFMGAKYVDEHLIEFENFYSFNEINEGEFVYTNWFDPENELQYHTSWDWLMPVKDKVIPLTDDLPPKFYDMIVDGLITSNITQVYNSCVEVIKFYNNQNK